MNDSNYKIGWQVACWSTLGVLVFSVFSLIPGGFFDIMTAIALAGIGVGHILCSGSLDKVKHGAAASMKSSAIMMFVAAGLAMFSEIIYSLSDWNDLGAMLIFISLMNIGAAVVLFIYKAKFGDTVKALGLPVEGMLGTGILLYSIALAVIGFAQFLLFIAAISWSWGLAGFAGVVIYLGIFTQIAGAIVWFIPMLKMANASK